MRTIRIFIYSIMLTCLAGCLDGSDKLNISKQFDKITSKSKASAAVITSVDIVNDQLVIQGSGLDPIIKVKVKGPSGFNEEFQIESNNGNKIVSNGFKNILFALSGAFSLIISDAHGAAIYQIGFTLQDGAVTGEKIHRMGATTGQVLSYDGTKWSPRSLDGLTYKGTFDASSSSDQTGGSTNDGFYYIVQIAGTNDPDGGSSGSSYAVGDWAIRNGSGWNKIIASNAVSGVNGETGNVQLGINHLTDVDTNSSAPTAGQVLKWNSGTSKWEPANDATGGSAGSVTSTTIQDGSITGTDVAAGAIANANLASDIDASKITAGTLADARLSSNVSLIGQTIGTFEIEDGVVTDAKLAAGISQAKINGLAASFAGKVDTTTTVNGNALSGNIVLDKTDIGLSNVTNDAQLPLANRDNGALSTSTVNVPTSNAVKTYVDAQVSSVNASQWTTNGSDIYFNTGSVGIGKTNPSSAVALDVVGKIYSNTVMIGSHGLFGGYGPGASSSNINNRNLGATYSNTQTYASSSGSQKTPMTSGGLIIENNSNTNSTMALSEYVVKNSNSNEQSVFMGAVSNSGAGSYTPNFVIGHSTASNGYTERLRIDSNGNVGIGTDAPGAKLEVVGQIKVTGGTPGAGKVLTSDAAGLATWQTPASGSDDLGNHTATQNIDIGSHKIVSAGGTYGISVANDGKVGIGTNAGGSDLKIYRNGVGSPTLQLLSSSTGTGSNDGAIMSLNGSVYGFKHGETGGIFRFTNTVNNSVLELRGDKAGINTYAPSANLEISKNGVASSHPFMISADDATNGDIFIVDSNGRVGIGTNSPSTNLEVAGQIKVTGGTPGVGKVLTSDAAGLATWQTPAGGADNLGNHIATQNIQLGSHFLSGDGGNEGVFVNGTGFVGIGTNNPSNRLHVEGGAFFKSKVNLKADGGISWTNPSLGQTAKLITRKGATATTMGTHVELWTTGGGLDIKNPWGLSSLFVQMGGSSNSGNVGIGTLTPSAKLEVTGQVKITGGTPGAGKVLTSDATGLASWQTPAGASVGGADTQIQYNNSGVLAGSNKFSWNNSLSKLWIGGAGSGYSGNIGGGVTAYYNSGSAQTISMLVGVDGAENNSSTTSSIITGGAGAQNLAFGTRNTGETMRITTAGDVGIGTQVPAAKLQVDGAAISRSPSADNDGTIDFGTGNLQYTTASCTSFNLHNLKSGGSYSFAVQGTSSSTCSFNAFSGAGTGSLTVHLPLDHGATTASKHTLYSFIVMGSHVYVSWMTGI